MPLTLLADLHTHSVASGHGFSTVTEIATAASAAELELVAITDHGPSVPGGADAWYFWNVRAVPVHIGGVIVLMGCEANVTEAGEGVDIPAEVLAGLDVVAVGFHPLTGFDDSSEAHNTAALLRAMRNPLVDVVTHPGSADFPLDVEEIAAAAAELGVVLELNDHSFDPHSSRARSFERETAFAEAARDAGGLIYIGSDAHYHAGVGSFARALEVVESIGFPPERILNRDAASVLDHLRGRRPRPRIETLDGPSVVGQPTGSAA